MFISTGQRQPHFHAAVEHTTIDIVKTLGISLSRPTVDQSVPKKRDVPASHVRLREVTFDQLHNRETIRGKGPSNIDSTSNVPALALLGYDPTKSVKGQAKVLHYKRYPGMM